MTYEELVNLVNHHCHLYYDLSKPEISDADFDQLYDKLVEIEKQQGWKNSNSPTLKVGGTAGKVKHLFPLFSLKKVYDKNEVDKSFTIETPKIDGTNLTIYYRGGIFYFAIVRGDGKFGDDVSHLVEHIKNIPVSIRIGKIAEEVNNLVAVTGECVTDNQEVKNFRNYVSGALGLKEASEFKSRNIAFIAHDMFGWSADYSDRMNFLYECGFKTVLTDKKYCNNYPQDGIVFRLDNYDSCQKLGYTSKHPRFAVALKPRLKNTALTTLQSVEWNVGRTGTVNPVGIVDPVELEDATITRVTLHNMGIIENLDLGLGDLIEIERAGGVIPKIIGVKHHSTFTRITKEDAEKSIGGETYWNGPRLYVKDLEKHGTIKLLQHFITTLGIKGLGIQSIRKLGITHPVDLYTSQPWHILGKNGEKVQEEIKRSETKSYSLVLAALGIEGVGKTAADKIVKVIPSFDRLKDIELYSISTIGPKTKEKIVTWLVENEEWVKTLPLQLEENVSTVNTEEKIEKKFCITGKLDLTKDELAEILAPYGFVMSSSVTKDCYVVISDGKESTKFKKAKQYGIKILNYWEHKDQILKGQL